MTAERGEGLGEDQSPTHPVLRTDRLPDLASGRSAFNQSTYPNPQLAGDETCALLRSIPMVQPPDQRQHAPATERNREPICAVLAAALPDTGTVLEIASGTGQHALFFASRLAPRHWLPSDPNPIARDSIRSWQATASLDNLHAPIALDMTVPDWTAAVAAWQQTQLPEVPPIRAIANINMIHISPWTACEGLFAGAGQLLSTGDVLYLYGPFKRDGQHTASSNEAFDRSLRSQNPAWGIRDLAAVTDIAQQNGFTFQQEVAMPANNLSLIFHKA